MNDTEDSVVTEFRRTINEFKTPLLSRLEEEGDDAQNVEKINTTLQTLDTLYSAIKRELESSQKGGGDTLDEKAALAVFEKRNLFSAARADPSLRDKLLHALEVDLKMYPFTRSIEHIANLEQQKVKSHQREIVPNLE